MGNEKKKRAIIASERNKNAAQLAPRTAVTYLVTLGSAYHLRRTSLKVKHHWYSRILDAAPSYEYRAVTR